MTNWIFNPSEYEESNFQLIPTGDHRVRVRDVAYKTFRSGNEGFEVTLDVSGHNSKLWYYLVKDSTDQQKSNQRLGDFLRSFGITDYDASHYHAWVGKVGAVHVAHVDYNGNMQAKVRYCIDRKKQEALPPAKFHNVASAPAAAGFVPVNIAADELPFKL